MQYALLIHLDDAPFVAATNEQRDQMTAPYMAYNEALIKAGAMVSGERLKPATTATVVKVRDDKTEVLDGPFADTKEQLAGFYIIEAPDMDAAIKWAARCPGAGHGTVEVRPVWQTR
ncbi:MAG: YciI family protein [Hyphomicrobiales bacterium]|nr:YciI family protein [Hyphomicrobiales bacterium]